MKPIRVLIIEDNNDDIFFLKELFNEGNFPVDVECCSQLREGLSVLAAGNIDIVLLDLNLPDSDGFETFEKVYRQAPSIPAIVFTGHADQDLGIKAIAKGAQDYLIKGQITGHHLIRSIQYALERKNIEEALRTSEAQLTSINKELTKTVEELKDANRKILEDQKSIIEEERLKVLLQISGTTAHELHQLLTALLGNIELMKLRKDDPGKIDHYIDTIESSVQKITTIAKRMSALPFDEDKHYYDDSFSITLHQNIKLLVLEPSDTDYEMLCYLIKDNVMIGVSRSLSIRKAMDALKQENFDLVISDYNLRDGNALDLLNILKNKEIDIPVVVITGQGDEVIASQLIKGGAYDYIAKKDIDVASFYRSINGALEKFRLKKDIQLAWSKMAQMATKDELTGLYNYRYFMEAFKREVDRAKRYKTDLAFCMIDLDNFKRINDTYGHPAGDAVLAEIGKLLMQGTRLSDLVCRYGGEEFAVILPNTTIQMAELVCERLRKGISEYPFNYKSDSFNITISAGLALYSSNRYQSTTLLLENADQALYQAKQQGKNKVMVYCSAPQ